MRKIGIVSDAHGNGAAFQFVIDWLLNQGASEIYFLGDAIGYIPSLSVLKVIEAHKSVINCIQGNHEFMFLKNSTFDCNDEYYLFSKIKEEYTKNFDGLLQSWGNHLVLNTQDLSILFVHGSPNDFLNGYVYPDTDLDEFECQPYKYVFMGHTHRPFIKQSNNVCYVNVGSCGLPRDHGLYGSAAVMDLVSQECQIIRFDIRKSLSAIYSAHPGLHPSVTKLFDRQPSFFYGEIVW
jgi:predicted phosphodiesterase